MSLEPRNAREQGFNPKPPPLTPQAPANSQPQAGLSVFRLKGLVFALAVSLACLHFFPPGQVAFYPPCLFHRVTGLECPGCGATRAVYFLLHGEVATAWRQNPLLVCLSPLVLLGLGTAAWKWIHRRPIPPLPWHPWSILALLVALAVFGVVRNLGSIGK